VTRSVERAQITVLHCRSSVGRFGPERVLLELAPALRARGVEPRLLALYRPQAQGAAVHPWIAEARAEGLTADQILDPGPLSVGVVRRLGRRVHESGADILHTHDYRTNILGGLVARRTERAMPWVATVHLHTTASRRLRLYRALDLLLLRLADQVITVSRDQRRLLLQRGVDRRRLALIPPAVDAAAFAAHAGDPKVAREHLGVPAGVPLVTLVGRLAPQKGIDDFLTAAQEVRAAQPTARFLVVGSGPQRAALESLRAELGLAEAVTFIGYQENVATILATSDVVALPSRAEGFPVVLIEAMAMARPVVASCVGGVPDLVRHGETGLLVPPNVPARLARGMLRLLENPDLAARLGEAGRQHVTRHCSPDRAARRLVSIYRLVLSERG
jgi:glycosyltransferase involved in cell wall biosynthesis